MCSVFIPTIPLVGVDRQFLDFDFWTHAAFSVVCGIETPVELVLVELELEQAGGKHNHKSNVCVCVCVYCTAC